MPLPGEIYRHDRFYRNEQHEWEAKYLVVAKVDRECCTFIVNSRIHPFIEAHPSLSVCQVRIDAARQILYQ